MNQWIFRKRPANFTFQVDRISEPCTPRATADHVAFPGFPVLREEYSQVPGVPAGGRLAPFHLDGRQALVALEHPVDFRAVQIAPEKDLRPRRPGQPHELEPNPLLEKPGHCRWRVGPRPGAAERAGLHPTRSEAHAVPAWAAPESPRARQPEKAFTRHRAARKSQYL